MNQMQVVPLSKVKPGFNYRKQEDPETWKSFVASIKNDGVLVPLEVAADEDGFIVIAGDRRYRAAKEAQVENVPIMILEGTETDFNRLRLIENVQRADVNPMDEGEEFVRQMQLSNEVTVSTIAESIKKHPSYVLSRVKLTTICEPAKNAIRKGDIPMSYGLILSRIPDKKDQIAMLQEMYDKRGIKLTIRDATEVLYDKHGCIIKKAIFDQEACKSCNHNVLNQQLLFMSGEKQEAVCLNAKCYQDKTVAALDAMEAYYKEHNQRIIKDRAEMDKLFLSYGATGVPFFTAWDRNSKPKTYASNCKKCEKLVFVRVLGKNMDLTMGEGCTDKACYRKLTTPPRTATEFGDKKEKTATPSSSPMHKQPTGSDRTHAEFMRNRIIDKNVLPLAQANETVRYRLAVYHLVMRMHKDLMVLKSLTDPGTVIKQLTEFLHSELGVKYERMVNDRRIYEAIAKIPAKKIVAVFHKLINIMMVNTEPEVMVATIDELKVDRTKFAIDKEYLETFTKGELIEYIKANKNFGHPNGIYNESEKRSTILETILKQNLAGKLNKAVETFMT